MLDSQPGFAFGTMRLTGEGFWGPPAPSALPVVGLTQRFELDEALALPAELDPPVRAALEGLGR